MSENNLAEDSSLPPPLEADVYVPTALEIEVENEKKQFKPPNGFIFCLPNILRGQTAECPPTHTVTSRESLTVQGAPLDPEVIAREVKKLPNQPAYLFSARELPEGNYDLSQWMVMQAPYLYGPINCIMVHVDTWNALKNLSIIVRSHRSTKVPGLSEIYEIYAMPLGGAALAHANTLKCTKCGASPAPVPCRACDAPYCSQHCRANSAKEHDDACLAKIAEGLSLTINRARVNLHENGEEFRKQQQIMAERNRGKTILVRRVDKQGNILSEKMEQAPDEI